MFLLPFDSMRLISPQGPRASLRSSGRVLSAETAAATDPSLLEWRTHNGTDWTNAAGETEGTILRAGARAVVLYADNRGGVSPFGGYGNAVVLQYADRLLSLYAHCRDIFVTPGATVAAGAPVSSVGRSSSPGRLVGGAHLHWELVTRWPLRSDQHQHRYNVAASLAAAGYQIKSSGRVAFEGSGAARTGTRPATSATPPAGGASSPVADLALLFGFAYLARDRGWWA